MKKVLLVAYHFPPVNVSSGLQRTLSFVRYAREFGWEPIVLTISPAGYTAVSDNQLADIPSDVLIKRAFGRDTARHLSAKGRYPRFLALPDRWVSWLPAAMVSGARLIHKHKPDVIWSTFPIATAHLIGLALHRYSKIPWVADFRDSMTEENYPTDKRQWQSYRWIEKKIVEHAAKMVFTAPSTAAMYQERYPETEAGRWGEIPNGYDEALFSEVEKGLVKREQSAPLVLLHSGILYQSERDPGAFFNAVAALKSEGQISSQKLKIIFRATGHDALYRPIIQSLQIEDIIILEPGIGYREALAEMMSADGLLLFQGTNCNHQIPAKIYEYFRAGKPILAFTDDQGDTAALMRVEGGGLVVPMDDICQIKEALLSFITDSSFRHKGLRVRGNLEKYSRRAGIKQYCTLLDSVIQ